MRVSCLEGAKFWVRVDFSVCAFFLSAQPEVAPISLFDVFFLAK